MHEAEFELEAVTPIFMRGADQTKAEIRSTSIKGLMRWWFRALAGNYFGNDITGLKKAEEFVFGSTNQKSKVDVEIAEISGKCKRLILKRIGKKCKIDESSPSNQLKYLWFSINLLAGNCKLDEYYPDRTRFTIRIKARDIHSFNVAVTSFWTLITLGSIGFRSRRGAGCLKFVGGDLNVLKELSLKWKMNDKNDLKNSILTAIERIGLELNSISTVIGLKSRLQKLEKLEPQPYPILNQRTSFVGLWDAKTGNPIEALKRFQKEYSGFRASINKDIERKKLRIVFGSPLVIRKRIKEKWITLFSEQRRRASPIMIGISEVGHKRYLRVMMFRTKPYHPEIKDVNWKLIKDLGLKLGVYPIFGSLEVFG